MCTSMHRSRYMGKMYLDLLRFRLRNLNFKSLWKCNLHYKVLLIIISLTVQNDKILKKNIYYFLQNTLPSIKASEQKYLIPLTTKDIKKKVQSTFNNQESPPIITILPALSKLLPRPHPFTQAPSILLRTLGYPIRQETHILDKTN